jgi:hypothetical protein
MGQQRSAPARPLWDRITFECATRGWNTVRLERETGIPRQTINKWRTQPRTPHAENVNTVARVLDIDPVEALQLAGILPADEHEPTRDERSVSWDELIELIEDARARNDQLVYDALMDVKRKRDAREGQNPGPLDESREQQTG